MPSCARSPLAPVESIPFSAGTFPKARPPAARQAQVHSAEGRGLASPLAGPPLRARYPGPSHEIGLKVLCFRSRGGDLALNRYCGLGLEDALARPQAGTLSLWQPSLALSHRALQLLISAVHLGLWLIAGVSYVKFFHASKIVARVRSSPILGSEYLCTDGRTRPLSVRGKHLRG